MRRTTIREYEIGPAGYSYIEDHLKCGGALSELLLRNIRLSGGKITTYLPEGIKGSELNNFDHAILPLPPKETWELGDNAILVPVIGTSEFIAERILTMLQGRSNWFFLIEDIVADEGDLFLKNVKVKTVYTNKKVMYYATQFDDKSEVEKTLQGADISYGGVGIIAAVPDRISLPLPQQLSEQILEEISKQVAHMVVKAYDGDGYLWWGKNPKN